MEHDSTTTDTPATGRTTNDDRRYPARRRSGPARRIAVAGLAVIAGLLTVAPPASASTGWRYFNLDGDRCYEVAARDTDRNGRWNQVWYDLDGDCRWDTHQYDTGRGDWLHEVVLFDMDEDGRWDIWLQDTNQRAGFDRVYHDDNGDGRADRSSPLRGPSTTVITSPTRSGVSGMLVSMARLHGTVA